MPPLPEKAIFLFIVKLYVKVTKRARILETINPRLSQNKKLNNIRSIRKLVPPTKQKIINLDIVFILIFKIKSF
jgi:hypothetical protein